MCVFAHIVHYLDVSLEKNNTQLQHEPFFSKLTIYFFFFFFLVLFIFRINSRYIWKLESVFRSNNSLQRLLFC